LGKRSKEKSKWATRGKREEGREGWLRGGRRKGDGREGEIRKEGE